MQEMLLTASYIFPISLACVKSNDTLCHDIFVYGHPMTLMLILSVFLSYILVCFV